MLGLIFLRYADHKFSQAEKELANKGSQRRFVNKADYQARGVMYLPPSARFSHLLKLPEGIKGDAFGKICEYFLGKFALSEGQKGGEFFTPTSLVKLIVEVIEPYHGRIFDPACGSGGMFVQSARFVENHKKNPSAEIMAYGQERVAETIRLCKMNLAVHGLSGDIR